MKEVKGFGDDVGFGLSYLSSRSLSVAAVTTPLSGHP